MLNDSAAQLDRRSFLKLGLAGSALLSAAGLTATLAGCGGKQTAVAQGYRFLRDADVVLFRALIPQLLQGLPLDQPTSQEVLRRIDVAGLLVGAPAQAEIRKLFDLLNNGLLRRLTTGVSASWDQASAADIGAFLDRWRSSSVGVFNAGYRALVKLACVSYFGQPVSRVVTGYPGPLESMYKAVNS